MITAQKLVEPCFTQNMQIKQEKAFNTFMEKMNVAEKSVVERGLISEEDAERELAKT